MNRSLKEANGTQVNVTNDVEHEHVMTEENLVETSRD